MKKQVYTQFLEIILLMIITVNATGQITERTKPAGWDKLVPGARFIDRFLPIPQQGELTSDTWGADDVIPRYTDNGIEDSEWSYWGGNIMVGDDGKYHIFVCRWREDSPKGHFEWPNSIVVHAVADKSSGPFKVEGTVGKGHNPEAYRLTDGRYVVYVIDGYYIADNMNGPWTSGKFDFDSRDRKIIEGLSNLSFAQREDSSYIMVCRGGGIWFSKDGISPYYQVTDKSVYPPVEGRFEDPVLWRDNIQYNLIVNDWYGRIAYYLRSKDGIHWKVDPGEAYTPGITKYQDGTNENWFKYERIKILQDEYGRAIQANFAVIDTIKWDDKPLDRHSSKNICIPLNKGLLITILGKDKIDANTKSVRVKIQAEEGFDPQADIDISSLRFGASEEVNFGRGSKVKETQRAGDDLIVLFDGAGNGLTDDNFAAKLIGKTKQGEMIFGFARLPLVDYLEPELSSRLPVIKNSDSGCTLEVEVQNFGQVPSGTASIEVEKVSEGTPVVIASGVVPVLNPFEKTIVKLECATVQQPRCPVKVILRSENKILETLDGELKAE